MTSLSNLTRLGSGKRSINQSTSAIPSPSSQRSLDDMLPRERSNSYKDLQSMLLQMQELMLKNHEDIKKEIGEVRNDTSELKERMQNMDKRHEAFEQQMLKQEQKIQDLENRIDQDHKQMEDLTEKLVHANKELENTVIQLESEKANHFLRFQNLREEKSEDLPDIMADILSKALGIEKDTMLNEIDEVYRINTNYARRYNLPKEVHIKLVKKSVRDEILHRAREDPIDYKGRQLVILKQVPKHVRDLRRPYTFLSAKLTRHSINFRWLVPEGMLVTWQERKIKIDSVDKAEEFFEKHFTNDRTTEITNNKETRTTTPISEQPVDQIPNRPEETLAIDNINMGNNGYAGLPKETRSTRATRPKYR